MSGKVEQGNFDQRLPENRPYQNKGTFNAGGRSYSVSEDSANREDSFRLATDEDTDTGTEYSYYSDNKDNDLSFHEINKTTDIITDLDLINAVEDAVDDGTSLLLPQQHPAKEPKGITPPPPPNRPDSGDRLDLGKPPSTVSPNVVKKKQDFEPEYENGDVSDVDNEYDGGDEFDLENNDRNKGLDPGENVVRPLGSSPNDLDPETIQNPPSGQYRSRKGGGNESELIEPTSEQLKKQSGGTSVDDGVGDRFKSLTPEPEPTTVKNREQTTPSPQGPPSNVRNESRTAARRDTIGSKDRTISSDERELSLKRRAELHPSPSGNDIRRRAGMAFGFAGVGAALGLFFGPFAPIASPIGAFVGGCVGLAVEHVTRSDHTEFQQKMLERLEEDLSDDELKKWRGFTDAEKRSLMNVPDSIVGEQKRLDFALSQVYCALALDYDRARQVKDTYVDSGFDDKLLYDIVQINKKEADKQKQQGLGVHIYNENGDSTVLGQSNLRNVDSVIAQQLNEDDEQVTRGLSKYLSQDYANRNYNYETGDQNETPMGIHVKKNGSDYEITYSRWQMAQNQFAPKSVSFTVTPDDLRSL
ncbi:MAG: hypothetical protein AAF637_03855 [Pseudomonadota bacterium]